MAPYVGGFLWWFICSFVLRFVGLLVSFSFVFYVCCDCLECCLVLRFCCFVSVVWGFVVCWFGCLDGLALLIWVEGCLF